VTSFRQVLAFFAAALLVSGCTETVPTAHLSGSPVRLSEWGLFHLDATLLEPNERTQVYLPANQLFTDYAHKLRTLYVPAGSQARLVMDEIEYPVGTILSKTFYYPTNAAGKFIKVADQALKSIDLATNTLMETRILVRRDAGWEAFPYVWNDEQTEAFLRIAGATKKVSLHSEQETTDFSYFVPNGNQCSGCHVTSHPDGGMHPLGAIASQLHAKLTPADAGLQTSNLVTKGWLDQAPSAAATASWQDESLPLGQRAAAYLNMQCGHCHNPEGAADTSALILSGSHTLAVNMGICKPPIAAGGGAGNFRYGIHPGKPNESILTYRMASQKPDEMMPELGRSLAHAEGIALVSKWIEAMPGSCQ
jgi:uncharacterized repeat protein (TIGR03806 family)